MLTSSQKKTTLFIAAVASAVFGGIQLVPIFASLNKTDPTPTPINTVMAPGGIAIAGNTINELPINNSSPVGAVPVTCWCMIYN